jgi:aromatic ring hydroxylase
MGKRDVTIGAAQWTVRMVNGDEYPDVRTTLGDVIAFETMIRTHKRGSVSDNAIEGQAFTVWRALRRLGKLPADTKYELWRDSVDGITRHDDIPADPTQPGPGPG